jgi:hypothetical protein
MAYFRALKKAPMIKGLGTFSSEADTGSRQESAIKSRSRDAFGFREI